MFIEELENAIYQYKNNELTEVINKYFPNYVNKKKITSSEAKSEIDSNIDALSTLDKQTLVFAISRMNVISGQFEARSKIMFAYSLVIALVGTFLLPTITIASRYHEETESLLYATGFSIVSHLILYVFIGAMIIISLRSIDKERKRVSTTNYFTGLLEYALKRKEFEERNTEKKE